MSPEHFSATQPETQAREPGISAEDTEKALQFIHDGAAGLLCAELGTYHRLSPDIADALISEQLSSDLGPSEENRGCSRPGSSDLLYVQGVVSHPYAFHGLRTADIGKRLVENRIYDPLVMRLDTFFHDPQAFDEFAKTSGAALREDLKKDPAFQTDVCQTYLETGRYAGLLRALEFVELEHYPASAEQLTQDIQQFISAECWTSAFDALRCAETLHIELPRISDAERTRILKDVEKESIQRTRRQERMLEKDKTSWSITDEVARFYIAELCLENLQRAQDKIDAMYNIHSREAPLPLRIRITGETGVVKQDLGQSQRLFREFLFLIVAQEIQETNSFSSTDMRHDMDIPVVYHAPPGGPHADYLVPEESMLRYGTSEEIRTAMDQAMRFYQTGSRTTAQFGGKKWVDIAEVARDLWKSELDVKLVDRAIDLQHNNGSIFNKTNIDVMPLHPISDGELKHFLDARSEARNLGDLVRILEAKGTSPDIIEKGRKTITILKDLYAAVNEWMESQHIETTKIPPLNSVDAIPIDNE